MARAHFVKGGGEEERRKGGKEAKAWEASGLFFFISAETPRGAAREIAAENAEAAKRGKKIMK